MREQYAIVTKLTFTFQALLEESIKERTTVITKSWLLVVVTLKPVRHIDVEPTARTLCQSVMSAGLLTADLAFNHNEFVTLLVDHQCADCYPKAIKQ